MPDPRKMRIAPADSSRFSRRPVAIRTALLLSVMASVATGLGCPSYRPNAPEREAAARPGSDIVLSEVSFQSGGDVVPALLARPAGTGTFPAVVVIHANSLREPYIGETVDRLAKAGFVGIAVDVFHFLPRVGWEEFQNLPGDLIRSRLDAEFREDRLVRNVQSSIDFLHTLPFVRRGGVALLGFCGGGWNAFLVAAQSADVESVVAFYAPVAEANATRRSPQSLAGFITVPVQYHRATEDPYIQEADVERFTTALRSHRTPVELFTYPASHGFFASNRGVFNPREADLAWSRTLPFLRAHTGHPVQQRPVAPPWQEQAAPGDVGDSNPSPGHWLLHRSH